MQRLRAVGCGLWARDEGLDAEQLAREGMPKLDVDKSGSPSRTPPLHLSDSGPCPVVGTRPIPLLAPPSRHSRQPTLLPGRMRSARCSVCNSGRPGDAT